MDIFYLTPNSVPLLAKFLLSLIVTIYVCLFVEKTRPVFWFTGYLIGYSLLDLFAFMGQTIYAPWVGLNLPIQYISALILAFSYLQFSYLFKDYFFVSEHRRVQKIFGLLGLGGLTFILFIIFKNGFGPYTEIQILLSYVLLSLVWAAVVFYRKYRKVLHSKEKDHEQSAYFSFFVLTVLAVLLSFNVIFQSLGLISDTLNSLIFFVLNLLIFAGLTITFINYLAHRTTVMIKLVGLTLVLFLTVIGLQAIVLIPNSAIDKILKDNSPDRQTLQIAPSDEGFQISESTFNWQDEVGEEILSGDRPMYSIQLATPFQFVGSEIQQLAISEKGHVFFNESPSSLPNLPANAWNCRTEEPALIAGCMDFPDREGPKVYVRESPESTLITWKFGQNQNEAQARLFSNGTIQLSYRLNLNNSRNIGIAGISGTPSSAIIDYTRNYREDLHYETVPLVWFLLVSTILILALFPVFYGKSVLHPLKTLLEGVRQVDSGDYDTQIPVTNYDEISYVTRHFNNMTRSLKKANEDLKAYAEELEERVEKRTHELHLQNKALDQANKKLEEQTEELALHDQFRSRLFMNISHELRTPLTLISGPIERVLGEKNLSEPARRQLEVSKRNTGRLRQLVEQILDLNRLESDQLHLKVTNVDVVNALHFFAASFESMLESKGLSLVTNLPDKPIEIFVEPDKLEKIMTNLISNASKFTPEGGTVTIGIQEQENDIIISVQDTGKGMTPEKIHNIFNRFATSAHEQDDYREGLGLGLAMTKEYVELHGGNISVESTPGEGTTFEIILLKGKLHFKNEQIYKTGDVSFPANIHKYHHQGEPPQKDQKETKPDSKKKEAGKQILVVEDNRDMASYIQEMLEAEGYDVRIATNGKEGLAMLSNIDPDLIISDIMMPKMDGMTFLKKVNEIKEYRDIPSIFLSARSDMEGILESLQLGVNDYLVKPFNTSELLFRIKNLIEFSESRSTLKIELTKEESPDPDKKLINKLTLLVEERISQSNLTVDQLAPEVAMSRRTLYREIKKATGFTPAAFVREIRLQKARQKLETGNIDRIGNLSRSIGFETSSYFSKMYYQRFGKQPSDYFV